MFKGVKQKESEKIKKMNQRWQKWQNITELGLNQNGN